MLLCLSAYPITLCYYASAPVLLHYAPMPQPRPYYTMLLCLSACPITLCSYASTPALLHYATMPQRLPYYTMLLRLSPGPIMFMKLQLLKQLTSMIFVLQDNDCLQNSLLSIEHRKKISLIPYIPCSHVLLNYSAVVRCLNVSIVSYFRMAYVTIKD